MYFISFIFTVQPGNQNCILDKSKCVNEINLKTEIVENESVQIPSDFPFPFEAYNIQKGFMSKLYECLELGKIGIFESPTGTGKSLSIICGALKWLRDYQEQQRAELQRLEKIEIEMKSTKANDGELDWISEFKQKKEKEEELKKVIEEQEVIRKHELKVKELKSDLKVKVIKRKRTVLEDEFDDLMKTASKDIQKAYREEVEESENMSNNFDKGEKDEELIVDYDSDKDSDGKDDYTEEKEEHVTKIYFCSRTHSQLSQFVREVIKSPYGDDIRVVSLGSRQNLCVNSAVTRLKALSLMNEVCLDMQKKNSTPRETSGESSTKKRNKSAPCPYYRQEIMNDFKDKVLLEAMDMEQIVTSGNIKILGRNCFLFATTRVHPSVFGEVRVAHLFSSVCVVSLRNENLNLLVRIKFLNLLCLPFERRETYCFSLIFSYASSSSASSQRSLSGP
jgi:chromosome transmission fidelity protein 1